MKILLDNNVPTFVLTLYAGHDVEMASRLGWADLSNGKLLTAAEDAGFELLITLDKGFAHQQNPKGRRISVMILIPGGQARPQIETVAKRSETLFSTVLPGTVTSCSV